MVDVAIKYIVADLCIDAFFNQVFSNFKISDPPVTSVPKIGDFYSKVSHNLYHEIYYNCHVVDVEKVMTTSAGTGYIVYFKYASCDSEDEDMPEDLEQYIKSMGDDLTDEELEELMAEDEAAGDDNIYDDEDDEDVDYDDVDLVATDDPNVVGASTIYFTFYK